MYEININWTLAEFINIMKEKVIEDFDLENAEFVDTQQNLPHGLAAEDAPAVQPRNVRLIDYYGNSLYQLSFYIRPLASLNGISVASAEEIPEMAQERACVICMNRERNLVFLPCNRLCACNICGMNLEIRTCPICRTEFNNRLVVYV
jgi:hypothetical protein